MQNMIAYQVDPNVSGKHHRGKKQKDIVKRIKYSTYGVFSFLTTFTLRLSFFFLHSNGLCTLGQKHVPFMAILDKSKTMSIRKEKTQQMIDLRSSDVCRPQA